MDGAAGFVGAPQVVLESVGDVVIDYGPDRVIRWASPSLRTVLGYDPDVVIGTRLRLAVEEDLAQAEEVFAEALASGSPIVRLRPRLICADGSLKWTDCAVHFMRDAQGELDHVVLTIRDATTEVESTQRFQLAMEHSAIGIALVTPSGAFMDVNPALCRMLDRDAVSLMGMTWQDLTHPDDVGADQGLADQLLAGDREWYRLRKRYLKPDGSQVWGDLSVSAARDASGRLSHFVAQVLDVTEHVRAAARYRLVAEHIGDVVVVVTTAGMLEWVSSSAEAALGWDPEEAEGTSFLDYVHPDDVPEARAQHQTLLSGESARLEVRLRARDGSFRWMDVRITPTVDEDGAVAGWVAGARDVDTDRATRDALELERAQFRLLAENSSDIVTLVRADGTLEWLSPSVQAVLGWEPADLIGTQPWDLIHPDDRESSIVALAEGVATPGDSPAVDVRVKRASADYVWMEALGRHAHDTSMVVSFRLIQDRVNAQVELAAAEEHYRLLADHATDVIVRSGRDATIEWVSPSVREVLGYQVEDMVGSRLSEFMHPDDLIEVAKAQQAIIGSGRTEGRSTARFRTADGRWLWMSIRGRAIVAEDGRILGGIDSLRDVEAEHDAVTALEERERELIGIVHTLSDPWALLAAVRDEGGSIVDFTFRDLNDLACAYYGMPREDLVGVAFLDRLAEPSSVLSLSRLADVVESGRLLSEDDQELRSPVDGSVRRFDIRAVRSGDGVSLAWRDVTDDFEAGQRLRHQAEHDILTGVPNRRLFEERMAGALAQTPRTGTRVAVLYCDVDNFKRVNDTLGHDAGDHVLRAVAAAIRGCLREGDFVGRLGGDEFVIVLNGVQDRESAADVARKVGAAVGQEVTTPAGRVTATVSIGVALAERTETAAQVLARADDALYAAKRGGRDRVVLDES